MSAVSAAELERVEAILQKACGLSLSPALRRGLAAAVGHAAKAMDLAQDKFVSRLLAGEADCVAMLVEQSVIGETYFFRHPEQFAALRERLTGEFAELGALSVWSAGCASGEEPYSLSMALLDAGRARRADKILATDVSEHALKKARAATYGKWSLRRLDPNLQKLYFEPRGEQLVVKEEARRRVEFRQHNLVLDPAPVAGCQVVFCRNVLIYFNPETAAHVLRKLADALAPGGYLILGPVEVSLATTLPLQWIEEAGATLLRRPAAGDRLRVEKRVSPPPPMAPAPARPPSRLQKPRKASSPHLLAAPAVPPPPPLAPSPPSRFELAREAVHNGRLDEAERLAKEEMSPESFLLLSMAAESRGDLKAAVDQVRKALYLEPSLATGHAFLVSLYQRLGKPGEAERARRNALDALAGMDEGAILRGVEAMTAGALRRALEPAARR